MRKTAAWIALAIDIALLGIAIATLFTAEDLGVGLVLFSAVGAVFAVLTIAVVNQLRSRPNGSLVKAARFLCCLLPIAWLVGSLDHGIVSGLEIMSVIVVGAIGALNWAALPMASASHA